MRLDYFNKRVCLFGSDLPDSSIDAFKAAYVSGKLAEGRRIFYGSSRTFAVLKGNTVLIGRYRENWNGYHDVAVYSLPDWEEIGTKIDANPAKGLHSDKVVV